MPGGRHRSSLRDLGLSGANSPNPYKHGSAKRVVRVLDYSGSEDAQSQGDAAGARRPHRAAIPLTSAHAASRPRAARGGRQNLAGIREAFDAEDAENKRKLERLNGRIADLATGSMLREREAAVAAKVAAVAAEARAAEGRATRRAASQGSGDWLGARRRRPRRRPQGARGEGGRERARAAEAREAAASVAARRRRRARRATRRSPSARAGWRRARRRLGSRGAP